jgi:hypothetical protein
MSTTTKTLGLVLAGVLVILFYIATPVLGAIYGKASPLTFMIYVGDFLSFLWLSVIVYISFDRSGRSK